MYAQLADDSALAAANLGCRLHGAQRCYPKLLPVAGKHPDIGSIKY